MSADINHVLSTLKHY